MRVVIIGGTGHVGSYLVPRLVLEGYEVISISRNNRKPYVISNTWKYVDQIRMDRSEEEKDKNFGNRIKRLSPDIVIDMICFELDSAKALAEKLMGYVEHFLHCGTIWVHGHSEQVPTRENQARKPIDEYGMKKAEIESYLLSIARLNGFPVTIIHPGHLVGLGWVPLNPAGNFNIGIFKKLADGEELVLPNIGMETVHHVHSDDVAQCFIKAITHRNSSIGESFHAVSDQAITLRGYATAMSAWFGNKAKLSFLPWDKWKQTVSEIDALRTWDHISHSPNCSNEKAKRSLEYCPRYSSLQAIQESVNYLLENNLINTNYI